MQLSYIIEIISKHGRTLLSAKNNRKRELFVVNCVHGLTPREGNHIETTNPENELNASGLSASGRRHQIVQWVQQYGEMKVEQLRHRFNVSEVTLRRDLEILESQNLIRRVRGGAVPNTAPPLETLFQVKLESCIEQKREIALAAASMVEDGQVVILSAGTTTTYIARELVRKKELTVVTTAINIGAELAAHEHITLVMVGGIVRKGSYASVGHLADETLSTMHADFAFVGADGIDVQAGFTTPNLMESRTDSIMLGAASKGIIVADSSKFGKVTFSPILGVQSPYMLITDSLGSPDYVMQLRDAGCRVFTVGENDTLPPR